MSYRAIVYWGGLRAWSPSLEDPCDPALPLGGKIFAWNYVKTTQCVCPKAKAVGVGGGTGDGTTLRKNSGNSLSLCALRRLSLQNKAIKRSCLWALTLTPALPPAPPGGRLPPAGGPGAPVPQPPGGLPGVGSRGCAAGDGCGGWAAGDALPGMRCRGWLLGVLQGVGQPGAGSPGVGGAATASGGCHSRRGAGQRGGASGQGGWKQEAGFSGEIITQKCWGFEERHFCCFPRTLPDVKKRNIRSVLKSRRQPRCGAHQRLFNQRPVPERSTLRPPARGTQRSSLPAPVTSWLEKSLPKCSWLVRNASHAPENSCWPHQGSQKHLSRKGSTGIKVSKKMNVPQGKGAH